MDSAAIRWFIASLLGLILASVVISDLLKKRKSKVRKPPTAEKRRQGFRSPPRDRQPGQSSWKNPGRR